VDCRISQNPRRVGGAVDPTCIAKIKRAESLPVPLSLKKAYIQPWSNARLENRMRKKRSFASNGYLPGDPTPTAKERMELYYLAHPRSPSAVRRPQLLSRGDLWIALLGPSIEKGIVGIGASIEAAFRAFDEQYLSFLRPTAEGKKIHDSSTRGRNRTAEIQSGSRS
jgi:hypothetical protein